MRVAAFSISDGVAGFYDALGGHRVDGRRRAGQLTSSVGEAFGSTDRLYPSRRVSQPEHIEFSQDFYSRALPSPRFDLHR